MRTIYLVSNDVVATVGSVKADAGIGSGLMIDEQGRTVGFDLYVEVESGKWVHASELPAGVLAEERRRGQLQHGIFYGGRLIDKLNPHNVHDRLIAAKVGLEVKADNYSGGRTAFKAQIGNPLDQLARQVQNLIEQIERLRGLDEEAKQAELEALTARLERLKKLAKNVKKEKTTIQVEPERIEPEQVRPSPQDFIFDLTRSYKGKTLSTTSLLQLAKAERISELVEGDPHALLLDPQRMAALRNMLLQ